MPTGGFIRWRGRPADDLLPAALEKDGGHAADRLGDAPIVSVVGVGFAIHGLQ